MAWRWRIPRGRGHGRDGLQGEAASEDRQPTEERLGARVEQVIAPGNGGGDGLLARRQIARPVGEQLQPIAHLGQQRLRGEDGAAGRGQLDRQRQPIQLSTERGHGRGVRLGQGKCRPHGPGALGEELDRLVLRHDGERGAIPWQGQRIDRKELLGMEMERGAAGGQHLERGTAGEQGTDEIGRCGHQVLAVVEQEQRLPRVEGADQDIADRGVCGGPESEGRGDRGGNQGGIGQRRQIDPHHPIREVRRHVTGDGQRQAGLAHPTGTGQGQQRDGLIEERRARRGSLRPPGR